MEKIIKEFTCISKVQETKTHYTFKAKIKPSNPNKFRIEIYTKQYKLGCIKYRSNAELFFNNEEEMIKEIVYHYNLNKNSLFTQYIRITKWFKK